MVGLNYVQTLELGKLAPYAVYSVLSPRCALQVLATNEYPSSPTTNFLKVYKVSASAPTNSFAVLMYGPLIVPAGGYGCPGGSNSAGAL